MEVTIGAMVLLGRGYFGSKLECRLFEDKDLSEEEAPSQHFSLVIVFICPFNYDVSCRRVRHYTTSQTRKIDLMPLHHVSCPGQDVKSKTLAPHHRMTSS
eukprot:scaffold706_cov119-Skeletonema_dohrnii-CCMP3373.AAC.4